MNYSYMRRSILIALWIGCLSGKLVGQTIAYQIQGKLENYQHDSIYLGYYFADKQYLLDTAVVRDGSFAFEGTDTLVPGSYLVVMPPDNRFFQLMINDSRPNFSFAGDVNQLEKTVEFEGSTENEIFYENLRFIAQMRERADSLTAARDSTLDAQLKEEMEGHLQHLNEEVMTFQKQLVNEYPETLTAALIKSGFRIEIPEYEGTPEEVQQKKYLYYKKHYFDFVDLGDNRLIRSPQHVMYDKVNYYLDKLTPKNPDSIILAIDYLLAKLEPAPDAYRTFLIKFLNDYAASKIVGMDAVYVHLAEKYYGQGKAAWVDQDQLSKIIGNARDAKPTLIGKTAPNFTVQRRDSTDISLYDIDAPYIVLVFWAHDCAHCKETMPHFVKFQEDYSELGVSVFSVCTKVLKDEPGCWEFVDEKKIDALINASDKTGGRSFVRTLYNVRRTPKVFVLDQEKKIISKELGVDQLREYFDTIIKPDKGLEHD